MFKIMYDVMAGVQLITFGGVSILTGEGEQAFSKREGRILTSCLSILLGVVTTATVEDGNVFISYFSKGGF